MTETQRAPTVTRLLNSINIGTLGLLQRWVPYWPLSWIEAAQRRRLRAAVRHAYRTVPFYREVMDAQGWTPEDFRSVADLERLPLIDADFVRTDITRFASSACGEGNRLTAYSGSGHPVHWDRASMLHKLAYSERDRAVICGLVGKVWGHRQLYILPVQSALFSKRALWEAQTATPRRLAERYFLSADTPFELVARRLNELCPDVGYSYGSYAEALFRYFAAFRIPVSAPQVWAYGGDNLSAGGRALIENEFGCKVISVLQAVETSRLAFQCERRDWYHLNVDLCAVRLVDERGQTCPPGEVGEIVVSNLINRATVLLNFRLGDLAVMTQERCPCGRTLPCLSHLNGRQSEIIRLADGRGVSTVLLLAAAHVELSATLAGRIVQTEPGRMCWLIQPAPGADLDVLRAQLVERAHEVFGAAFSIDIEWVSKIPLTSAGKLQHAGLGAALSTEVTGTCAASPES
jgi:phenylacetate-CoA ligase